MLHKNKSNGALGFFLTGIVMGSLAAIFVAPRSGSETRRYLRRKADAGAGYVKDRTEEMRQGAIEMVNQGSRHIQSQVDRVARSVAAVCR